MNNARDAIADGTGIYTHKGLPLHIITAELIYYTHKIISKPMYHHYNSLLWAT